MEQYDSPRILEETNTRKLNMAVEFSQIFFRFA